MYAGLHAVVASIYNLACFSQCEYGHFSGSWDISQGTQLSDLVQRDQQAQWRGRSLVGNTFRVDWRRRHDVVMSDANHLTNPWNEDQPVRIGRDGQEMPASVGKQLVDIIECSAESQHVMRPCECSLALSYFFARVRLHFRIPTACT